MWAGRLAPPSRPHAAVATHGGRPFHLGGLRSLRGGRECSRAGFDSSTVVPYQAASQLGYRDVLRPATLTVQAATRKPPPACFHVEQRLSVETVCSLVDHPNCVASPCQDPKRISFTFLFSRRLSAYSMTSANLNISGSLMTGTICPRCTQ